MASKAKSFSSGDLVLVKATGSPYWPAVVKPCVVDSDDESYEFNGEFHRSPDWYWVLFFENAAIPDAGCWARASKIRNYSYKMNPMKAKDSDLIEAHSHADKWAEKYLPALVDKYTAAAAANGDASVAANGDPGATVAEPVIPPEVRRTARRSKPVQRTGAEEPDKPKKKTALAAKRPASASSSSKRTRNVAPAQKRPRRGNLKPGQLEGDAHMSADELRKALWAERVKVAALNESMDIIRKAARSRL